MAKMARKWQMVDGNWNLVGIGQTTGVWGSMVGKK
jgi:hypothetical protein